MQTVLDVASYILNRCAYILNRPISNLQLQKVLYFTQGKFLAKYDKALFNEDFIAWQLGPVVSDVYFKYNSYISDPILEKFEGNLGLTYDQEETVNSVIDEYSRKSAWDLVEESHKTSPWENNFRKGKGTSITKAEIRDYFRKQN